MTGYIQYDGFWRNDKRHGRGSTHFSDGSWFSCLWEDDVPSARGELHTSGGAVFIGDWGIDSGEPLVGMLTSSLNPALQANVRGRGEVHYRDGSVYRGQWLRGLRHGEGDFLHTTAQRATRGSWTQNRLDTTQWFTSVMTCGLVAMPDAFALRGEAPRKGDRFVQTRATAMDPNEVMQGVRLQLDLDAVLPCILEEAAATIYQRARSKSKKRFFPRLMTVAFLETLLQFVCRKYTRESLSRSCTNIAEVEVCTCVDLKCLRQRLLRTVYTGQLDRAGLYPRGRGVFESRCGATLWGDGWDDIDIASGRAVYPSVGTSFTGSWAEARWKLGTLVRNDGPPITDYWLLSKCLKLAVAQKGSIVAPLNEAGKPHGPGKMTLYDGSIVSALWVNGVMQSDITVASSFGTDEFIGFQLSDNMFNHLTYKLGSFTGVFVRDITLKESQVSSGTFGARVSAGTTTWSDYKDNFHVTSERKTHTLKLGIEGAGSGSDSGDSLAKMRLSQDVRSITLVQTIRKEFPSVTLGSSDITNDWQQQVEDMRAGSSSNQLMVKKAQYNDSTKCMVKNHLLYEKHPSKSSCLPSLLSRESETFKCKLVNSNVDANDKLNLEISIVDCYTVISKDTRPDQVLTTLMYNGNLIKGVFFDVASDQQLSFMPHPEQLRLHLAHGPVFVADLQAAPSGQNVFKRGTAPLIGVMTFPNGGSETRRLLCEVPDCTTIMPFNDTDVMTTHHGWRLTVKRELMYRSTSCRCTPAAHMKDYNACSLVDAVTPNGTTFRGSYRKAADWMWASPSELVGRFTLSNGVTMDYDSVHIDQKAPFEGVRCTVTVTGRSNPMLGCWRGDTFVSTDATGAELLSADDGQYVGERNEAGERHGHGKCVYVTGAVYEGRWEHGVRCGHGTYTNFTGDATFTGEFQADRVHGNVTLTRVNGTTLVGIWNTGEFVSGVYTDIMKNVNRVKPHPLAPSSLFGSDDATIVLVDEQLHASIYKGSMIDGVPNFQGKLTVFADVDAICKGARPLSSKKMAQAQSREIATYEGCFVRGQFTGIGSITHRQAQYRLLKKCIPLPIVSVKLSQERLYTGSANFTDFNHIEFTGEGRLEQQVRNGPVQHYELLCQGKWRSDKASDIWGHKKICNGILGVTVASTNVKSADIEIVGKLITANSKRTIAYMKDKVYEGFLLANEHPFGCGTQSTKDESMLLRRGTTCKGELIGLGEEQDELNGDHYIGLFMRGRRHCFGRMRYANGDVHSGWWVTGAPGGLGALATERGVLYIGYWSGPVPFGDGTVIDFANRTYSYGPQWKDAAQQALADRAHERRWGHRRGLAPGKATWVGARDKCNRPYGKGVMTRPDGVVCRGMNISGTWKGACSIIYPDGTTYVVNYGDSGVISAAVPTVGVAMTQEEDTAEHREALARVSGTLREVQFLTKDNDDETSSDAFYQPLF